MGRALIEPNTVTYSSAISACEKDANWQRALHLLTPMGRTAIEPNTITYNSAIIACENGADSQRALDRLR